VNPPSVSAAQTAASYWPFVVLLISMTLVAVLITIVRMHAFLALILAAVVTGLLAARLPGEPAKSHWVQAVELTTTEFGIVAGNITLVIALASVIGMCLMESGGADKVVRRFLAVFGDKRAPFALLSSSYVLSMPIFFDTFFMLLIPIARALSLRTGRNYALFVMAICCGALVTHGVIAPHPGPLAMAQNLQIDLGLTILAGILVGVFPVLGSWWVARRINAHMTIPLRETAGIPLADLEAILAKREEELPSFISSILPVILPIALIAAASCLSACGGKGRFPHVYPWVEFWGNRNVALFIGAVIAMVVLARQKGYSISRMCELLGPPFETAGVIVLITSAGGAFGLMLKNAGVGEAIKAATDGRAVDPLLLAYVVACVIRVAQGSATVAMLTTSAIMAPILQSGGVLPYHPVYIFLAIGFGAVILSWMNDSGFWVISRMSAFTEKETLKTWTVVSTVISVVGLIATWICAKTLPFV